MTGGAILPLLTGRISHLLPGEDVINARLGILATRSSTHKGRVKFGECVNGAKTAALQQLLGVAGHPCPSSSHCLPPSDILLGPC